MNNKILLSHLTREFRFWTFVLKEKKHRIHLNGSQFQLQMQLQHYWQIGWCATNRYDFRRTVWYQQTLCASSEHVWLIPDHQLARTLRAHVLVREILCTKTAIDYFVMCLDIFRGYGFQRKDRHPAYKTSNSEYGRMPPNAHTVAQRWLFWERSGSEDFLTWFLSFADTFQNRPSLLRCFRSAGCIAISHWTPA